MLKKKMLVLAICLAALLVVVGCGNDNAVTNEPEKPEQTASNFYKYGTPVAVDNVVFTITEGAINPVKGDRTEDNYADENGEYFALGGDIVKAADYEQIVSTHAPAWGATVAVINLRIPRVTANVFANPVLPAIVDRLTSSFVSIQSQ